jgi:hypothetical protein
VGVKYRQIGGAPSATSFSDNFNRGNEPLQGQYFVGSNRVNAYNIVGNQLVANPSGVSGQEAFLCTGAPGLLGSRSQYIELTWITADVLSRNGSALYLSGMPNVGVGTSQMSGYFFHAFPPATINLFGIKLNDPNYTLALALGTPAANDVFGLQVDIRTGSNRVRLWQNATLLADVSDTDAARATGAFGMPGFYGTGLGGAIGSTWDNLSIRASR